MSFPYLPCIDRAKTIVTHAGAAHRDDLLACAILLALNPRLAISREMTVSAVTKAATDILLVDIGGEWSHIAGRWDHHQLPQDGPARCSLSLLLHDLALLEGAQDVWPWLHFSEVLDDRGPFNAAKLVGCDWDHVVQTLSPVEQWFLRRFSSQTSILPGSELHTLLLDLGTELLDALTSTLARLALLQHMPVFFVHGLAVLDLRAIAPADEATRAVELFCRKHRPDIAMTVSCDDRGPGLSLYRRNDHPQVNFAKLDGQSFIRFAHKGGFLAKTNRPPENFDELWRWVVQAVSLTPAAVTA